MRLPCSGQDAYAVALRVYPLETLHRYAVQGVCESHGKYRGMTDRDRQWRLFVENRLQELRSRHGEDLEHDALPAWLDTLEGALQRKPAADQPNSHAPVAGLLSGNGRAASGGSSPPVVGGGLVGQGDDS